MSFQDRMDDFEPVKAKSLAEENARLREENDRLGSESERNVVVIQNLRNERSDLRATIDQMMSAAERYGDQQTILAVRAAKEA